MQDYNNGDSSNFNINELQMAGPAATPVLLDQNIDETQYSLPSLSTSTFDSETSEGQLYLLDSEELKFKQEEK